MHEEKLLMDLIVNSEKVPPYVSYAFLASIILIVVALVIRSSMKMVPTGIQNFVEVIAEGMLNLCEGTIGHHWGKTFYPLIATLFMYILTCNFMGLIPGFVSPTANINMTASMAVPVFLIVHFYGIRVHGPKYIMHFMGPIQKWSALPLMVMMFLIEIISHLARPVTLSVRLFGNMIAKHYLLMVLGVLAPAIIPTAILGLGVLVSVVQSFVFALLATIYLSQAVEEGH